MALNLAKATSTGLMSEHVKGGIGLGTMNRTERGHLCPSIAIGSAVESVATALFPVPH